MFSPMVTLRVIGYPYPWPSVPVFDEKSASPAVIISGS